MDQDEISRIKQAVREVLLSEEFLQAFTAAWWTTPVMRESKANPPAASFSEEVKAYSNEVRKYER